MIKCDHIKYITRITWDIKLERLGFIQLKVMSHVIYVIITYMIETRPDYAKTYYFVLYLIWFFLKPISKIVFHAFRIKIQLSKLRFTSIAQFKG